MKKILFTLFLLMELSVAYTHPGIGIVKDSKENIYYTDLKQVWKISPDGKRTIIVPNVHTHELYIDSTDNLYGEHLWYNGEKKDTWGYYVWCLENSGKLVKILKPTEGFRNEYSFVRDKAGNMYWAERFTVSRFKKKTPRGQVTTLAEGKFKEIRWMHATPEGNLFFIDWQDLYKIDTTGRIISLAKNLSDSTALFSFANGRHSLFGIWTDSSQNIYVANYSGQVVKKITPTGVVSRFIKTTSPWSPTGGLFDKAGNLWLMEYSDNNETRVRKISKESIAANNLPVNSAEMNTVKPLIYITGLIVLLAIIGLVIRRILPGKVNTVEV